MDRIDFFSFERSAELLSGLRFLCRLFWGPDARQSLEMTQGGYLSVFNPLKASLSKRAAEAVDAFGAFLKDRPDPDALRRELQITHTRLFVSDREALSAPMYQSCYLFDRAPLMGAPAIRMRDRLASAGLSISCEGNEPPDHLAVELEYLYFLLAKGLEDEDPEYTARAADFAESELSAWLPLFAERLSRVPDAEPYNFAASLTLALVQLIAGEGRQLE